MSNNQVVVVVASNFQSFIGSMKANLKLGYTKCEEATYVNGFFRARLVKDTDEAYVARLSGISGEERDNVLELVDFLSSVYVPVPQALMDEMKEIVDKAEENKAKEAAQTEAVTTTIKRTRKPRGKK
jgi:hypothetical protein